ncbi:hypothetical protein VE04_07960 [Pseudogymnoascus sp. 24MN13]|nr:hypothetical protein VE04_07960 [Pseudogymnoascus sp. 24MN13]
MIISFFAEVSEAGISKNLEEGDIRTNQTSSEADETKQETFQGSVQDSQVTTRSMTLRRSTVQGHESFSLTPDVQTRAKNETAIHVRPSAGQLLPSIQYPPDPVSTAEDKSTDYGSVLADYEWE